MRLRLDLLESLTTIICGLVVSYFCVYKFFEFRELYHSTAEAYYLSYWVLALLALAALVCTANECKVMIKGRH